MTIDTRHLVRKSGYAAELGTALHEASELILNKTVTPAKVVGHMLNGIKIEREPIQKIVVPYVNWVKTLYDPKTDEVATEQKAYVTDECWGTADFVILADNGDGTWTLKVIDLKTGAGNKVSPVDNTQLLTYALGMYLDLKLTHEITKVEVGICQPPFDVYALKSVTVKELEAHHERILNAINAVEIGETEYVPSESSCQWCPASSLCPKLNDVASEAAKIDFEKVPKTGIKMLAQQMEWVPLLKIFIKAVEEEASTRLMAGKNVKGFKVVAGRNSRQWKLKQPALEKKLQAMKIPKTWWYKQDFLSPPQMEAMLKEKGKDSDITKLIKLVPGGPTVAREDDKRPPLDPNQAAKKDFAK